MESSENRHECQAQDWLAPLKRALDELETIQDMVLKDMERGVDRMRLLAHHRTLERAVHEAYWNAMNDSASVESVRTLRVLRTSHIPDLWDYISEPVMRHGHVVREVRLILNLIANIVMPGHLALPEAYRP
ncbi:MAG: hypothetical protein QXS20_07000 [Candidatus Thorarchaeota archaeon]